jgi:2-oxo-3-(phosphooxy)propyl 3-oxoalkanoate synthase
MSHERLLAKIAEWSTPESQAARGRIDAELVHKHRPENVALARLDRYDPDHPDDRCVAEVFVDTEHPYFFEHPVDHVPGLLLIEAVRQTGIASVHQILGVPLDAAMIVDTFTVAFERYAELDQPLFVGLLAEEMGYRGDRLTSAHLTAEFVQGGQIIGRASMRARLIWWAR